MNDMSKSLPNSVVFKIEGAPTVSVSLAALNHIRDLVTGSTSKETGGILVGRNVGKDIDVTDASDPGPNAQQTATHFLRDTAYCRQFLARCYEESGADYVGEWPGHVIGLRTLSAGDINTLVGILIDPDYDFVSFPVYSSLLERMSWNFMYILLSVEDMNRALILRSSRFIEVNFPIFKMQQIFLQSDIHPKYKCLLLV